MTLLDALLLVWSFLSLCHAFGSIYHSGKKVIHHGSNNKLTSCRLTAANHRRVVVQHGIFLVALLDASPVGHCEEPPPECKDGAILPESAVPGGYQQVCMMLEERTISLSHQEIYVRQQSVGAGRTGVVVWNSGILLMRLLDSTVNHYPTWLDSKTVMEVGCGTGLASMAAAKLVTGASRVIATDGNVDVVELARDNALRNNVSLETNVLQWGFLNALDYADAADVIIGSDLTYNSGSWRVLAETFCTILKPGGIVIYLTCGHAGFNVDAELSGFLHVIKGEGLEEIVSNEGSPFPSPSISDMLFDCISKEEQSVLDATGGTRVVLLRKPAIANLK